MEDFSWSTQIIQEVRETQHFYANYLTNTLPGYLSDYPSGSAFSAWRHEQTQPRSVPSQLPSAESIALLQAWWNLSCFTKCFLKVCLWFCLPKASQPPSSSRVAPLIKGFSLSGFRFAGYVGSLWGGRSCWKTTSTFQPMWLKFLGSSRLLALQQAPEFLCRHPGPQKERHTGAHLLPILQMGKLSTRERKEPFPMFSNYMPQDYRDCILSPAFAFRCFHGRWCVVVVFYWMIPCCFVCSHSFLRWALKEAVYKAVVKSMASTGWLLGSANFPSVRPRASYSTSLWLSLHICKMRVIIDCCKD